MAWNDERVDQLKEMCSAGGLSAAQIANRLGGGVTRNAVIGKIHRLGIPKLPRLSTRNPCKRRPIPHGRRFHYKGPDNVPGQIALPLEPPTGPAPSKRLTLLRFRSDGAIEANDALTLHSCRWPTDQHGVLGWEFCGGKTVMGSSYCAGHLKKSTQPPGPPRLMLPEGARDSIPRAALSYSRILDPEAA